MTTWTSFEYCMSFYTSSGGILKVGMTKRQTDRKSWML